MNDINANTTDAPNDPEILKHLSELLTNNNVVNKILEVGATPVWDINGKIFAPPEFLAKLSVDASEYQDKQKAATALLSLILDVCTHLFDNSEPIPATAHVTLNHASSEPSNIPGQLILSVVISALVLPDTALAANNK